LHLGVTELESTSRQTLESENEITGATSYGLTLIIDGHNVSVVIHVEESVFVHMTQLTLYRELLLNLRDINTQITAATVRVVVSFCIHDFGFDFNVVIEQASRGYYEIVLEQ